MCIVLRILCLSVCLLFTLWLSVIRNCDLRLRGISNVATYVARLVLQQNSALLEEVGSQKFECISSVLGCVCFDSLSSFLFSLFVI